VQPAQLVPDGLTRSLLQNYPKLDADTIKTWLVGGSPPWQEFSEDKQKEFHMFTAYAKLNPQIFSGVRHPLPPSSQPSTRLNGSTAVTLAPPKVYLPDDMTFAQCAKHWLKEVGLSSDGNWKVSSFLNRLLGLESEKQNLMFTAFSELLTTVIREAKRQNVYDQVGVPPFPLCSLFPIIIIIVIIIIITTINAINIIIITIIIIMTIITITIVIINITIIIIIIIINIIIIIMIACAGHN
jgi:hypothetical protein